MRRLLIYIVFVSALAFPLGVSAQESAVIKYPPRNGLSFPKSTQNKPFNSATVIFKAPADAKRRGVEKKRGVYPPALPQCTTPNTWRKASGRKTLATERMDYTFFDATSSTQQDQARRSKRKVVAYQAGIGTPSAKAGADYKMTLAPTFGVRCLPTRFHFVEEDGKHYAEFREGSEAWR